MPRRTPSLATLRTHTRALEIRAAGPDDMAPIRGLIRLFPEHLVQRNLPRAPSFFVAYSGGKVVGCCALQIYSKRLAEVRSLAVHPDFQDRGVASKLVECCIERARERGVRELFAVTSQTSFFGKLGFATFRREKTAMFYELAHPGDGEIARSAGQRPAGARSRAPRRSGTA